MNKQAHQKWALLCGLVLLCAIPRLAMAGVLRSMCDDGFYYVALAKSLQVGDFKSAFGAIGLNVYPVVLAGMHALGIEWIWTGKLWGALISSLCVLPLYGLFGRLYDKRVALAACFLYAINPEFIEISAETMRESTFWCLFFLCLYFAYRAILELKWWLFLVAGFMFFLSVHTRTEGWFLAVPILAWAILRAHRPSVRRSRVALGTAALFAITPALLVVLNVTVLRSHAVSAWGRSDHIEKGRSWLADRPTEQAAVQPAHEAAPTERKETKGERLAWTYLMGLIRSQDPLHLALLVVGILGCWRVLLRRERLALILVCLPILSAIGLYLVVYGAINERYFLTAYLALLPSEALGFLYLFEKLKVAGRQLGSAPVMRWGPACGLAGLLLVLGWADALTTSHVGRERDVAAGNWLRIKAGPFRSSYVDLGASRVGYHATGTFNEGRFIGRGVPRIFQPPSPELVIMKRSDHNPEFIKLVRQRGETLGYETVSPADMPSECRDFLVLLRQPVRQSGGRSAHSKRSRFR